LVRRADNQIDDHIIANYFVQAHERFTPRMQRPSGPWAER
jgi:hypothetical protein